jgi:hypothetical protein
LKRACKTALDFGRPSLGLSGCFFYSLTSGEKNSSNGNEEKTEWPAFEIEQGPAFLFPVRIHGGEWHE